MARRKGRKKNTIRVNRWLSLAGLILSFFSLSRLGFVGNLSANLIRFFVGDLYLPVSLVIMVLSLVTLFKGKINKIKSPRITIGIILVAIGILVLMHALMFQKVNNPALQPISATWRFFSSDFSHNMVNKNLGGGMIGAILYGLFYFLFDQIGSYFIVFILIFTGILMLFDISYGQFFQTIYSFIQKLTSDIQSKWQDQKKKIKEKEKKNSNSNIDKLISEEKNLDKAKNNEPSFDIQDSAKQNLKSQEKQAELEHPAQITRTEKEEAEDISVTEDFDIISETENEDYIMPTLTLLDQHKKADQSNEYKVIESNVKKIEETFASFDVDARVVKANLGPAVTKYEIQLATGVKVSKIVNLQDDLALALAAQDIRIEAPIPGRALIGIEVPNQEVSFVSFRETMEATSRDPQHLLKVPIGKDISGRIQIADLAKMPHLLIAGSTGSGKSVAINSIITALLMRTKPNEVKLMMIDPKMVELNDYNGIPHLLTPVVTNPKKAARALNNVVQEMERRYELFASTGTKNRSTYNEYILQYNLEEGKNLPLLPYIVIIVDELADLMMVASKEVEDAIMRLAQMARAAGIHMILATQRPSVDVLTGTIKANIPSRMAFAVSSGTDSRTILDMTGAEKLLGKGDMLFLPMGANQAIRVQGTYIADDEVKRVVDFVKSQQEVTYVEEMMPKEETESQSHDKVEDEYFEDAVQLVVEEEAASISMLQRRFRIGYNRAARLIDDMEARGIIGPANGSKPREVLLEKNKEEENHQNEVKVSED